MNRSEIFTALKNKPEVSVLIVGGGINGIGTFRDLALNGVDVLLVDRGDFCSGASAASSHMAHGGIRYLENGEFRLVREAVLARFDSRSFNDDPAFATIAPTGENFAKLTWDLLVKQIPGGRLERIEVTETPESSYEYVGAQP